MTQKKELLENGFVKIPGVVPRTLIDGALKAINHSLGEGLPPDKVVTYRAQSYCPELMPSPAIIDLYDKSPAKELVGSVIELNECNPVNYGQIALRFPLNDNKPRKSTPHLDGTYTPENGVTKGRIENFTALVGVFLSDLPVENAGNFTVWPKTHRQLEQYFQEHGAAALLNGFPPIDLPEPVQITGQAGDIVIAHYNLAHSVTANISPHVRYACFFRIKHADINDSNWQEPMENMWLHWKGMQHLS